MTEVEAKKFLAVDAQPTYFIGWSVLEHKQSDWTGFNPKQVNLYQSPRQQNGGLSGLDLQKELARALILNGNVLDYLLSQPRIIPEEWECKKIFFAGTVYQNCHGDYFIRYLIGCRHNWFWGYQNLEDKISADSYVAIGFCP